MRLPDTRYLLLFDVGPTDPISYLAVAAFVTVLALSGTLVPGWQAVRRQPLGSLRED